MGRATGRPACRWEAVAAGRGAGGDNDEAWLDSVQPRGDLRCDLLLRLCPPLAVAVGVRLVGRGDGIVAGGLAERGLAPAAATPPRELPAQPVQPETVNGVSAGDFRQLGEYDLAAVGREQAERPIRRTVVRAIEQAHPPVRVPRVERLAGADVKVCQRPQPHLPRRPDRRTQIIAGQVWVPLPPGHVGRVERVAVAILGDDVNCFDANGRQLFHLG